MTPPELSFASNARRREKGREAGTTIAPRQQQRVETFTNKEGFEF